MVVSTRHVVLAGALAFVAGVGVGLGVGSAGERVPSASAASVPPEGAGFSGADAHLAGALRELSRTLAEMNASIARGADRPGAEVTADRAREVVGGADAVAPGDLAGALRELAAALRDFRARSDGGRAGAASPLVVPRWIDRKAAFGGSGMRETVREDDDEVRYAAERALRQRHLFWTEQQVLDRYGRPDEVGLDDGMVSWSYEIPLEGGASEEYWFYFHDGLVYSVSYGYDEP